MKSMKNGLILTLKLTIRKPKVVEVINQKSQMKSWSPLRNKLKKKLQTAQQVFWTKKF